MQLVEFSKKEIWAESHLVARKLKMPHNKFMRSVEKVIDKLSKLRRTAGMPKYRFETRQYRGAEFEACLMSREFFSLVMMRFETQKAFEWQHKFNAAFYEMERVLLQAQTNKADIEWTQKRIIGKSARAEETDAIAEFVEYATEQGSTRAKHYYKHYTNATYKALGFMAQKFPQLRDEMNIYELGSLMLAEKLVADNLRAYMAMKREYHDIYNSVKADLLAFADAVRPLQMPIKKVEKS